MNNSYKIHRERSRSRRTVGKRISFWKEWKERTSTRGLRGHLF